MANVRGTLPFLVPLRELLIAFTMTGYLIYKIPISDQAKASSKFLHPELADEEH
jgi:hypothetical protein